MVIKMSRRTRPALVAAALLVTALVVLPTASRADFEPAAYVPTTAPSDQSSTLEDALIALGIAGLGYLIINQ